MTYEEIKTAARMCHLTNFAERGDGYATVEEMAHHMAQPFDMAELIESDLIEATGWTLVAGIPDQRRWTPNQYCRIEKDRYGDYSVTAIVDAICPSIEWATLETAMAYARVVEMHALDCGF